MIKKTLKIISVPLAFALVLILILNVVGQTVYAISNSDIFTYSKAIVEAGSDVKIESGVAKIYKSDKSSYTVIVDPDVQKSAVASYLDDIKADLEDMEVAVNYAVDRKNPVMSLLGTLWSLRATFPQNAGNVVTAANNNWDSAVAGLMSNAKAAMLAKIDPGDAAAIAEATEAFEDNYDAMVAALAIAKDANFSIAKVQAQLDPLYSSLQKNIYALEDIYDNIAGDWDALNDQYQAILASDSGIKLVSTTTIEGISAETSKQLTYQDILDGNYDLNPVTLLLPASIFPVSGEKVVNVVSQLSLVTTAQPAKALEMDKKYSVAEDEIVLRTITKGDTTYTTQLLGKYDVSVDFSGLTWGTLDWLSNALNNAYAAQRPGAPAVYGISVDVPLTAPENINEVVNETTKTITLVAHGTPGPVNKYDPSKHTKKLVKDDTSAANWNSEDGSRTKVTSKYNEAHQIKIRKDNKPVDATVRCNKHGNAFEFEVFVGNDSVAVITFSNGNDIIVEVTDNVSFVIRWQTNDGEYHEYLIDGGAGYYAIPNSSNILDMWIGLSPEAEEPGDPDPTDPDPKDPDPTDPDPQDPDPKDPDPTDPPKKNPDEPVIKDKNPIKDNDKAPSELPYTGNDNTMWIAATVAGTIASIILAVLFIRKKRLV